VECQHHFGDSIVFCDYVNLVKFLISLGIAFASPYRHCPMDLSWHQQQQKFYILLFICVFYLFSIRSWCAIKKLLTTHFAISEPFISPYGTKLCNDCGTISQPMWCPLSRCRHSASDWKPICFQNRFHYWPLTLCVCYWCCCRCCCRYYYYYYYNQLLFLELS